MNQLKALFQSISLKRRLLIGGVALLVGVAVLAFAHWRRESDFRPLYKSLSAEDAGSIVQKLKEKGMPFRVAENGATVLVPSAKVAETRLEMAGAGLPKTGRIGFELFDKSRFGATDFAEHINFRRALEGELERSLTAMAEVETARVHVTFPKESIFTENRLPAKASVMLKVRTGEKLAEQNVVAVRYLVASAVEGLSPDSVSVMDMRGTLLSRPKEKGALSGPEPSEAIIEFRQKIERDLMGKMNHALEALLGAEKFRASVVAECDFSSGDESEETYDPAASVMSSQQRSSEKTLMADAAGVPGTASNLPNATPRPGISTGVSRETQNTTYQTSRTIRRMHLPLGNISRLSASVLVDQAVRWQGAGANARRVLIPPSPDTLKRINDVVAAAIDIRPDRGDRLVVETLPFEATLNIEPPAAPAPPVQRPKMNPIVILLAVIALLMAAMATAVVAMLRRRQPAPPPPLAMTPALPPAPEEEPAPPAIAASQDAVAQELEKQLAEHRRKRDAEVLQELRTTGSALQKLTDELRISAEKEAPLCAGVLRSWLTEG